MDTDLVSVTVHTLSTIGGNGVDFVYCKDMENNATDSMLSSQETCAAIYKGLFTDAEWTIIDNALSEYQDHFDGDDTYEEIIYNRVVDKIAAIFRLTDNN